MRGALLKFSMSPSTISWIVISTLLLSLCSVYQPLQWCERYMYLNLSLVSAIQEDVMLWFMEQIWPGILCKGLLILLILQWHSPCLKYDLAKYPSFGQGRSNFHRNSRGCWANERKGGWRISSREVWNNTYLNAWQEKYFLCYHTVTKKNCHPCSAENWPANQFKRYFDYNI